MAHRMQITLRDEQYRHLREESQRSGLSIAELVRRSVSRAYGGLTKEEKLRIIDETAGLWADRTDLPESSVDYVKQLRGPGLSARLEKLGLDPDS